MKTSAKRPQSPRPTSLNKPTIGRQSRLECLDCNHTKKYDGDRDFSSHKITSLRGRVYAAGVSLWQTPIAILANKKILFLVFFALFTHLYANPLEPKNFVSKSQQELQNPNAAENVSDLRANEFYLNLNADEIKAVQDREREVREAFDRFSQKEINYKPIIRPIASMDSISLHPYFTTSLLLPSGSIIAHIDSSTPMAVLKYENNAILVRPNADFKVANLTILYRLKDQNHILNLLANFYEKDSEEKLNLVYSYREVGKLEPLEVISAYIKEHNSLPKQRHSYIQIDDISYRIVEDEKHGNVFIKGKKYRVDNGTIFK